ncbi:diguanylate cyclase [Allokutzneria albata]|uniref:Diguanylate cyclase (GGDEF) domain-containing protein n=1 Tax=Allokutzneria albata TaxID=211114 RepID=A0A1G9WFU9_ALLAB|nr:diguanylate cyclase [Allokutzneria albata]SDM83187.1 diguanylate cyclase (GGDEF) domain-containing protein [Allokutzneria albata]
MNSRGPKPLPGKAWLAYLLIGLAGVGGYYVIPAEEGFGVWGRLLTYCLITSSAAVAVFVGLFRYRPRVWVPWLLLGLSQVVYASADATFYISHYIFGKTGFPGYADPIYISHYPLVVAGLLLLIRRRSPGGDLPGLLDAAVLAVVAAMLTWLYLIGPPTVSNSPALVRAFLMTFPLMDLVMLAVGLRLLLGPGQRPAAFSLLCANLFGIFAADTIYSLMRLGENYWVGNFIDAIWLAANLALGAAALHPTMTQLADRAPTVDKHLGPSRIAVLIAAALVAPLTLLVQNANGSLHDVPVIAIACALLFLLVIARLADLVSDQRRLAITDPLTKLHTRRFFEAQLPLEVGRAQRSESAFAVLIIDVDHFKSINDHYGHPAGDQALIEIAERLRKATRAGDVLARYGGEEFALLARDTELDELPRIAERLRHQVASSPIAVSEETWLAVTVSVGIAAYPLHGTRPDELIAIADRALYSAKARGRDRVVIGTAPELGPGLGEHTGMIDYLGHLADEVDAVLSTYEHSRAIARWARLLAAELGHDEAGVRRAELAGRLHDVGKIVIPPEVLAKPARLSAQEWELMRQHPDSGYRMVSAVPGCEAVAEIIRQHHERPDGTGYPRRLRDSEITIEAKIIAVCDAWAAMLSDRPYQTALTEEEARQELRRGCGTQFDPAVVNLFLELQEKGTVGDLRRLRSHTSERRQTNA